MQCEKLAESFGADESESQSNVSCDAGEALADASAAERLDHSASELASISCDSWRRMTHETIHEEDDENDTATSTSATTDAGATDADADDDAASSCAASSADHVRSRCGDYSPEYIEVEEPDEPVPTQDSCLQVTVKVSTIKCSSQIMTETAKESRELGQPNVTQPATK